MSTNGCQPFLATHELQTKTQDKTPTKRENTRHQRQGQQKQGVEFRVQGLGFRVKGSGLIGFRVKGV